MTAVAPETIAHILAHKRLALVGVSRRGDKFGNTVLKELKAKGYELFVVHPHAESIEGRHCYPTLADVGRRWPTYLRASKRSS
ncbi:MAG: hypothetical protein COX57_08475 [Alphaproteobacteria bacterium CG_4_10_14_0_2_um_filter_63_37]|nr:MAG: hypothetical protein AUJ55_07460 [Proteobacteria bacterium CG1_02_64_396]PJA24484.1 MAG: hypothetical protein COX57_08475 [Alphaproteobacteria bacterium CG_4_10_14_0_2_um_filter_63_37]